MPRNDSAGNENRRAGIPGARHLAFVSALTLLSASLSAPGHSSGPAGGSAKGNTTVTQDAAQRAQVAKTSPDSNGMPKPEVLALKVADRYGAKEFHRVRAMQYVFQVKFGGKDIERKWTWFPKEDSVEYQGKDSAGVPVTVSYSRRNAYSMKSPAVQPVDKMFINDQYWLTFPLHLTWDKGLNLHVTQAEPAPAGGKRKSKSGRKQGAAEETWKLTVEYPTAGGYTPGDAYDLYVDSSGMVKRWVYRKGNAPEPTREALWSDPVPMGPLSLSTDRRGPEGDFRLRFTGVRVDTAMPTP